MASRVVRLSFLLATILFVPPVAVAKDGGSECRSLPTSALRPHACNPQAECLRLIPANAPPKERAARERDCRNQPTSGTCYGPDAYNPQEECRRRK